MYWQYGDKTHDYPTPTVLTDLLIWKTTFLIQDHSSIAKRMHFLTRIMQLDIPQIWTVYFLLAIVEVPILQAYIVETANFGHLCMGLQN